MKEKSKSKDLYVANMSFEIEEEELQKLFSLCGTVRSIHMITDAKSGLPKGCAFVHMTTAAEAKDAINTLDGTYLGNRCISVTEALPRKSTLTATSAPAPGKPRRNQRPQKRRK
jgi:RNA recognition motif-containing protein